MTRRGLACGTLVAAAALAGCGGGDGPSFAPITRATDVVLAEANDLRGLTFAGNGQIYAAGFTDANPDDRQVVVIRANANGLLDTSFGDEGAVVLNLVPGDEQALAIVELANGDVVVLANVDDGLGGESIADIDGGDPVQRPSGKDVVLVRLDSDGELVSGFGTAGVLTVDFGWDAAANASWPVPTYTSSNPEASRFSGPGFPGDTGWDLQLDRSGASERLVVFGMGPAAYDAGAGSAQRYDNDRYVLRLGVDGTPDATFNGGAAYTFDSGFPDNARRGIVEADGAIVSAGYANFGDGLDNHVVLIRLLPNGTPDTSFGFGWDTARPGVARFNPYVVDGGAAEAYSVARLSDGSYVTTGYGEATAASTPSTLGYETSTAQDVVIFSVTGAGYVRSFGQDGELALQSEGAGLASTEDRSRAIVALSDDRTVHVGRFGGEPTVFVVRPDGSLDESVGEGGRFASTTGGATAQFFNVALSADGTRFAATTNNDANGARLAVFQIEVAAD
ncbi:MAG: hypothetical protein H6725_12645 [Sandaracinaceae bacterium]|nr:hypothetical protein [Sandaracinaceae bacterium]